VEGVRGCEEVGGCVVVGRKKDAGSQCGVCVCVCVCLFSRVRWSGETCFCSPPISQNHKREKSLPWFPIKPILFCMCMNHKKLIKGVARDTSPNMARRTAVCQESLAINTFSSPASAVNLLKNLALSNFRFIFHHMN